MTGQNRRPPRPLAGLTELAPYVPGAQGREAQEDPARPPPARLASNESPLGASPAARAALAEAAAKIHFYPDSGNNLLVQALADHHALEPERIFCGNGSDEIIQLLVRGYAAPQEVVLHPRHGFMMYRLSALAARAAPAAVALDRTHALSLRDLEEKLALKPKLLFFANPENPIGSALMPDRVAEILTLVPSDVLVVMDCAYAEYMLDPEWSDGFKQARERENFLILRTFSKAYGLAGLRIGWMYAPEAVVQLLHRLRGPFNVSLVAQRVARVALRDQDNWLRKAVAHNRSMHGQVAEGLDELSEFGLVRHPTNGNFARFDTPLDAARLVEKLAAHGILLRDLGAYGLPHGIRMTLGTRDECRRALAALRTVLQQARTEGDLP